MAVMVAPKTKASIFVYKNGEIKTEVEIPTSWENLFEALVYNPLMEDLSIKQVRQLSKIVVLAEEMKARKRIFEIKFEEKEVQKIYQKIA